MWGVKPKIEQVSCASMSDSWLMDSRGIMCELKNEQVAEFKLPWQLNLQQKLLIWHKYSAIRLKAERFSSFFVS